MIQDFHPDDREYLERMLGTRQIPDTVYAEYIMLRRMGAACARKDDALGFSECRTMLRRLGFGLPRDEHEHIDWRTLERGTKLIVSEPGKPEVVRFYNGTIDIGTIGVKEDMQRDPCREVQKRWCRIWLGEVIATQEQSVSVIHSDESASGRAHEVGDMLDDWETVTTGTRVTAIRKDGTQVEGQFLTKQQNGICVVVDGKKERFATSNVKLAPEG